MTNTKKTEIKVGLFVFFALAILASVIFIIGSRRNMFTPKTEYRVYFEDVIGLRAGSPVRMGGVNIGTVSEVNIRGTGRIAVRIEVSEEVAPLLREDSFVSVKSKGMLGDRLLDIRAGTPKFALIKPGQTIPSKPARDLFQVLNDLGTRADPIIEHAGGIAKNLYSATEPFGEKEFQANVRKISRDVARILNAAANGKGTVSRLLNDQKLANNIELAAGNIATMTAQLDKTTQHVNAILQEVRTGDGTAHELFYGQSGKKLIAGLSATTQELGIILKDVRTNESTVHDLLYSDRAGAILDNVTAMSNDLRIITERIREGKGTVGALLMDPSVYEDVKRLVGELERNQVLKALVRYSIRHDEKQKKPNVKKAK